MANNEDQHWDMLDFHALCKREGIPAVAQALGRSERQIADLRRGYHPLTVDDFYALRENYPDFTTHKTVQRIGAQRDATGRSRRAKAASGDE